MLDKGLPSGCGPWPTDVLPLPPVEITLRAGFPRHTARMWRPQGQEKTERTLVEKQTGPQSGESTMTAGDDAQVLQTDGLVLREVLRDKFVTIG